MVRAVATSPPLVAIEYPRGARAGICLYRETTMVRRAPVVPYDVARRSASPADPEGDPVTFAWSGWYSSEEGQEDAVLEANGAEASWRRLILMGEPAGGVVSYVARDVWGNADTVRFCIEGSGFRCR